MDDLTPEQYRALLRKYLCAFIRRCFSQLNPQTVLAMNWHIEVIAAKLEACRRGEIRRLIINVPPRHLKSLCASVAFPAWILGLDPAAQILCVSYAQDLADKLARDCRAVMHSSWYKATFQTRLASDKQAVQEFATTKQGSRLATSVGGVLTGRGADIIIIDDPLKPEEAVSDTQRRRVNEWFQNSLYSRQNDKQHGCIILIMQRLHEDDLVGHVLGQENWEVISFPAIAEHDEEHVIETPFGSKRLTRCEGDVLHPAREPQETLDRLRKTLGEYDFASQYQQSPAPLGGGMVKSEWFGTYEPEGLPEPFDLVMQSWDTANKASELSDYSVCTTWGIKGKRIYLLHVLRRRMEYPELKRAVREQSRFHKANVVLIEDNASGTQLIQELITESVRGITRHKPEHDKIMRLHSQTGLIENGAVYLPREAPWRAEYLHELVTFPKAKHDDQADSTSQALAWFSLRQVEPSHYVVMHRQVVRKLHSEGVPVAEIAAKVRKTTEEVQSLIDEDQGRRSADLKHSQAGPVTEAGKRWNPWMGTLGPK